MKSEKVPHDSFSEGFVVGYQLVRGINSGTPGVPGHAGAHGGTSYFLMGIKAGLKAAGAEIVRSDGEHI